MQGFARGVLRIPSLTKEGSQKYSIPKNPIELEQSIKEIKPQDHIFKKQLKRLLQNRLAGSNGPVAAAWAKELVEMEKQELEGGMKKDFADGFIAFLTGTHDKVDPATGRKDINYMHSVPSVNRWIRNMIEKRKQFELWLYRMRMFGAMSDDNGPPGLNDLYLHYKFIVETDSLTENSYLDLFEFWTDNIDPDRPGAPGVRKKETGFFGRTDTNPRGERKGRPNLHRQTNLHGDQVYPGVHQRHRRVRGRRRFTSAERWYQLKNGEPRTSDSVIPTTGDDPPPPDKPTKSQRLKNKRDNFWKKNNKNNDDSVFRREQEMHEAEIAEMEAEKQAAIRAAQAEVDEALRAVAAREEEAKRTNTARQEEARRREEDAQARVEETQAQLQALEAQHEQARADWRADMDRLLQEMRTRTDAQLGEEAARRGRELEEMHANQEAAFAQLREEQAEALANAEAETQAARLAQETLMEQFEAAQAAIAKAEARAEEANQNVLAAVEASGDSNAVMDVLRQQLDDANRRLAEMQEEHRQALNDIIGRAGGDADIDVENVSQASRTSPTRTIPNPPSAPSSSDEEEVDMDLSKPPIKPPAGRTPVKKYRGPDPITMSERTRERQKADKEATLKDARTIEPAPPVDKPEQPKRSTPVTASSVQPIPRASDVEKAERDAAMKKHLSNALNNYLDYEIDFPDLMSEFSGNVPEDKVDEVIKEFNDEIIKAENQKDEVRAKRLRIALARVSAHIHPYDAVSPNRPKRVSQSGRTARRRQAEPYPSTSHRGPGFIPLKSSRKGKGPKK